MLLYIVKRTLLLGHVIFNHDVLRANRKVWPIGWGWLVSALLLSSVSHSVSAQTTDRIIQQEQQRQEQQRRELKPEQLPRSYVDTPLDQQAQGDDNTCIDIQTIEFDGADLLLANTSAVKKIVTPYQGSCISIRDINELLGIVTRYYYDRGFVTSRAYVSQQDMSAGTLTVLVVESHVDSLQLTKSNGVETLSEIVTAFPTKVGEHLNLRDLEQGLDQLNRLRSNQATMEMIPGDSPGLSRVVIDNQTSRRYRFNVGTDNSGQVGTGELQHKVGFAYDNLLGINDFLAINVQSDGHRDGAARQSRSASVLYEVPFGYWTAEASLSYFEYARSVNGFASTFQTDGSSKSQSIALTRLVHRNGDSKTSVGVKLQHKDNANFIEDTRIETSSRELTIASLDVTHIRRLWGGRAIVGLGYQRGLDIFGALDDSDRTLSDDDALAQFDKFTLSLQYQRSLRLANRSAFYSFSVNAQHSDDILFSTEQSSIGGQFSVNGFKDDGLSGRSGGFARQSLSVDVFANESRIATWLGKPQLTVGFDIGSVRTDDPARDTFSSLKSASLGFNGQLNKLRYDLTYAEPIDEPDFIISNGREIYFSVNIGF